jgi:hypothetical protein
MKKDRDLGGSSVKVNVGALPTATGATPTTRQMPSRTNIRALVYLDTVLIRVVTVH